MGVITPDEYEENFYTGLVSEDWRYNSYNMIMERGYKKQLFKRANIDDFPVEDYTEAEYQTDPDTGELITNPDFFGEI